MYTRTTRATGKVKNFTKEELSQALDNNSPNKVARFIDRLDRGATVVTRLSVYKKEAL